MFANSVNEKLLQVKGTGFNKIKDYTLDGLRRQSQFDKEFDFLQANEHSEIYEASDKGTLADQEDDKEVNNILSTFDPNKEVDTPPSE